MTLDNKINSKTIIYLIHKKAALNNIINLKIIIYLKNKSIASDNSKIINDLKNKILTLILQLIKR